MVVILEHSDMEQEARQVALAPSEFLQGGRAGVRIKLEEQEWNFWWLFQGVLLFLQAYF